MLKRLPLIPTVIVLAAVATMLALGVWQLGRSEEKAALLASYAKAEGQGAEVAWPVDPASRQAALFRRSTLDCRIAGKDAPTPLPPLRRPALPDAREGYGERVRVVPQATTAALRGLARRHPGWRVVAGGAGRVVLVLDAARAPGHLTGRMGWGLRLLLGALVVAALARCALGCA